MLSPLVDSVLITGGTGFFGKAFVRYCLEDRTYHRICVFSRDEAKQAAMRDEFKNDDRLRFFIGDVRDSARLERAMQEVDHVVHAAALKRVEVGEYNPDELVKTNVVGSLNVIQAAQAAGVQKVVALSSDKACDPINAYGASKLLMEKIFLAANNARGRNGPLFAVTRYGNVAGSTGSVIPTWRAMLAAGATEVPITDIDATRFWMSATEAVHLVLGTLHTMAGGELVIPTLRAFRLGDLAIAMDAPVKVIGLRSGEKMHESLIAGNSSEHARRLTVQELNSMLLTL